MKLQDQHFPYPLEVVLLDDREVVKISLAFFGLLGDVEVEDDDKAENPPPVSQPSYPQRVQYGPENHSDPFVTIYGAQVHCLSGTT